MEVSGMSVYTEGAVVEEMTLEDSRAAFGAEVSDRLGITREQFLEALDRGDYDKTDSEDIIRLYILAPFGR